MPKKELEEEQKKQEEGIYKVIDVATQTAPMLSDGKNIISTEQALAKILNNQEKILELIK